MKYIFAILVFATGLVLGCKEGPNKSEKKEKPALSIPEKIAYAHGYGHWGSVGSIAFTFNVDRDTTHFERTWIWKPKTNEVTAITQNDTLTYHRKSMDSIAHQTNAGFINDRYWLLAPFNLVWDANSYAFEHVANQIAPISGEPMQKLTIVYENEGGYTPGDAYDFYFKDDFLIQEWTFRKSNQAEPSMSTTWEKYGDFGGLILPQDHVKAEPGFSLNFTNIAIEKE
ncbi:hypothetical protein [Flagellimonas meishanensis]|uniref:hypothetical protein n=1 Tax=Flagellimonas meishanensis TaxID=2873264 RepID=UPI001CA737D4|nr:hypothetical protein [[Muricauda] meishanensis]